MSQKTPLPDAFHRIQLRLAREPGHPEGDARHGYDIVAPLDDQGRIDPTLWREHKLACRVRRLRPDNGDAIGLLRRTSGGGWYFDYDVTRSDDDERGFRFGEERFVSGEYVSVREDDGQMHTFRIIAVAPLR